MSIPQALRRAVGGLPCANYAQFPIQPSTQLPRDHTKFLCKGGTDSPLCPPTER
jgi:hypothetical protein